MLIILPYSSGEFMEKVIVSKFGGTSMGDADCMLRSAEVSFQQKSSIVVVSATSGTTNMLIELAKTAQNKTWSDCTALITKIKSRHHEIAENLNANHQTIEQLNLLLNEMETLSRGINYLKDCSSKAMDTMMSLGERMSSTLFVEAMRTICKKNNWQREVLFVDARLVIITDEQYGKAKPFINRISEQSEAVFKNIRQFKTVFITQGFIGKTEDGMTTTLGRGGSDYSAALIAEGVNADILEIWTDVAGIATTDPRICKDAKPIDEISFKEASELATFGAKILHPATLLPAMRKEIPTFVGSSFAAQAKGTWVKREVDHHPLIRAMALRRNQILVTLSTPEMLHTHGFLFQIFKIFNDHQVSIDAITTSEISVSVTLDDSTLLNKKLISDLEKIAEVKVEEKLCLVSLIGNNINHTPGLAKKIFSTISEINVRMICLGASIHNFCFLVSEDHGELAIQKLHQAFVE